MSKKTPSVKSGQKVPASGQYKPDGKGKGTEVTLVKGKVAPPTPQQGQVWVPEDLTDNKSGKG